MSTISAYSFPLPGKPDPTLPKPEGIDTRPRVLQPSNSGICWYYGFNILRDRYKAPNTEGLKERKFERCVSELKKNLTAHTLQRMALQIILTTPQLKNKISHITKNYGRGSHITSDTLTFGGSPSPVASSVIGTSLFEKE